MFRRRKDKNNEGQLLLYQDDKCLGRFNDEETAMAYAIKREGLIIPEKMGKREFDESVFSLLEKRYGYQIIIMEGIFYGIQ